MSLTPRSFHWLQNQDGSYDGSYPNGDKVPFSALQWSNTIVNGLAGAGINDMETNNPFSHNVRQYLSGTEASTAVLSLVTVSGNNPNTSGFTAPGSGNTLSYTSAVERAGVMKIRATDTAGAADSPNINWSCTEEDTGEIYTTIPAITSDRTINAASWPAGAIIQLASGTHGSITFTGISGTASNPIKIIAPTNGTATFRRASPGGSGFIMSFRNCHYFIFDGQTSSGSVTAGPDGKKRGIKITYATGASTSNKDNPTGFIKFFGANNQGTGPFNVTDKCIIRYVEIDGGYDWTKTASQNIVGGAHIGIQSNHHGYSLKNYAPNLVYQEDMIFEHNYLHNFRGEAMYIGSNGYDIVKGGEDNLDVPIRRCKIRYNYIKHTGAEGINTKTWLGGTNGPDLFPNSLDTFMTTQHDDNSSIHDNFVFEGFRDPTGNGTAMIGIQSCKVDAYNNWIQDSDLVGLGIFVAEGVVEYKNKYDNTLTFANNVYNNVLYRNAQRNNTKPAFNAFVGAPDHGGLPPRNVPSLKPVVKVYNNTCVGNAGKGLQMTSDVSPDSHIENNICVDNGGANISKGAATSTNNTETGSGSSIFVNVSTADFHLKGSANPDTNHVATGTAGTNYSTKDIEGTNRPQGSAPNRGAYEF